MKNTKRHWRIIVMATLILLQFIGCVKKVSAQSGGGRKASPVSDFS